MADYRKNLANAIVGTAPSPATTGTSLVLQAGYGATMPAVPFWLTLTPTGQLSTRGNSEVVLVTARSTDTLSIVREQKGTVAQSIAAGWIASNGVYIETSTAVGDIVMTFNAAPQTGRLFMSGGTYTKALYPLLYDHVVNNPGYGTTTVTDFTLRDMSSRVPVGKAAVGTFAALAATGGAETHQLTVAELASHSHTQKVTANNGSDGIRRDYDQDGHFNSYNQGVKTYAEGGNQPHNNLQPYIVVQFEVVAS